MAIVAHVSDVALWPLIFMIILLMLGFVKHINPERHLIFFFLFDSIISDCKRYDLSVFKAQNKKNSTQMSQKQKKKMF